MLSSTDRSHLLLRMRQQTPSTVHRRMNVLLLLDDGWAAERIAEALFIDAETVREHRRIYREQGMAGLLERLAYQGAESDLSQTQQAELRVELDRRIYGTAAEICDFVQTRFGICCTPNAVSKPLGRLGCVYKKPKKCG